MCVSSVGPHVSQQPQSQSVHVGQIAHLVCGVEANPPASVMWLKNDHLLTLDDTRMMQLPSGSLDINNVEYRDAGVYQCNATSFNRHALSEKAELDVQQDQFSVSHPSAPRFVAKPEDTVAVKGSTVTLGCAAVGTPSPWVTWLKDGVSIDFA